jgi:hypothetical protein
MALAASVVLAGATALVVLVVDRLGPSRLASSHLRRTVRSLGAL